MYAVILMVILKSTFTTEKDNIVGRAFYMVCTKLIRLNVLFLQTQSVLDKYMSS